MTDQDLYDKLLATARAFVEAPNPPEQDDGDKVDEERILDTLAPDAHIRWGHELFVSTEPHLQGEKSRKGFLEHMKSMSGALEKVETDITASNVDVTRRSVVLRVKFTMTVKGHDNDPVPNDILFWIVMNDQGDQVTDVTEFVDPVAGGEIAKKVQEYKSKTKGGD